MCMDAATGAAVESCEKERRTLRRLQDERFSKIAFGGMVEDEEIASSELLFLYSRRCNEDMSSVILLD